MASMRSTNFPRPGTEPDAETWWHDVIGQVPDTRRVRPATKELTEEGPFAGGRLTLDINAAGIIQWSVSPPPFKEVPVEFPTVGRFGDVCEAFSALMHRWYGAGPELDRIAFGAGVLLPVPNRVEGYRLLSEYLHHVRIDPEASTDLLYQINRRRRSPLTEGLLINRLSKWSVAALHVIAQPLMDSRPERRMEPVSACLVELDINTAPEYRGGFVAPRTAAIFDELVTLAGEILEVGDRP